MHATRLKFSVMCSLWICAKKKTATWNRILTSKEFFVVGAPSLEALKARSDGALGSLSWWGAALPTTGALELDGL